MKGIVPARDQEDPRAAALSRRLRAWFAALSRQPAPARLIEHLDTLERGGPVNGVKAPERPER